MPSIFTKIIEEKTANFVYEDKLCAAILDIRPAATGHSLVIPRQEVDHWLDLPANLVAHLTEVAQKIGQAQRKVFECERVGMMIAGFEVPHTHLHVIPINSMADFELGALSPTAEDLSDTAARLASALS